MNINFAHPGDVLKGYLGGMQVKGTAVRLRVARATLSRILNGHAGITTAMPLRLSVAFAGISGKLRAKLQALA